MTMNLNRLLQAVLCAVALLGMPAFAQTFKMPCEVEATIPAAEDVKIKPQKVVIEIQSMGKNIFLKMNGPEPYTLIANSLATEEFTGKNLTTAKEMGAFRKHKVTGAESEIRIEQATVIVSAYHDTTYMGKKVRINITGPCSVPR
ncbi:hypothetical protein LMORI2_20430 [Limnohabitans sp. MORI2]|jgi:hypothetical protein|uniref:hypothetical protein n=1 Tax=Limnohabitans sp. MORI2 TaxID=1751150 RepID=UPI002376D567|nr:hypothetical protein [Limnohabitans sp. MORI2]BDU59061.1 hypothetical protein LMORI2_20430 [Limnohabitans sp. MORI2]